MPRFAYKKFPSMTRTYADRYCVGDVGNDQIASCNEEADAKMIVDGLNELEKLRIDRDRLMKAVREIVTLYDVHGDCIGPEELQMLRAALAGY